MYLVSADVSASDGSVSHHHGHQECTTAGGSIQVRQWPKDGSVAYMYLMT